MPSNCTNSDLITRANYEARWGADYCHLTEAGAQTHMCCCEMEIMTSVTSSCQCTLGCVSEAVRENQSPRTGPCSVISGRCGSDVVLKLALYFQSGSDALQGQSGVTF